MHTEKVLLLVELSVTGVSSNGLPLTRTNIRDAVRQAIETAIKRAEDWGYEHPLEDIISIALCKITEVTTRTCDAAAEPPLPSHNSERARYVDVERG